jgi:hypothetical protein
MAQQPERSPLSFYLTRQRSMDAEVRKLLDATAAEAARQIKALSGNTNVSSVVKKAQLTSIVAALRKVQADMWQGVYTDLQREVVRTTQAAYEAEKWMARDLFKYLPTNIADAFVKSQQVAATRIARLYVEKGIPGSGTGHKLSARVYHARDLSSGQVERMVRQQILLGTSARKLALQVQASIKPSSPGGVSYSAMRLARTELNNAFHLAQIDAQEKNPAALGAVWHLSGSHPTPDECNEYATEDKHGLGKGVFIVGSVPPKPHPNCLCFLTTKLPPRDEFIARMRAELASD